MRALALAAAAVAGMAGQAEAAVVTYSLRAELALVTAERVSCSDIFTCVVTPISDPEFKNWVLEFSMVLDTTILGVSGTTVSFEFAPETPGLISYTPANRGGGTFTFDSHGRISSWDMVPDDGSEYSSELMTTDLASFRWELPFAWPWVTDFYYFETAGPFAWTYNNLPAPVPLPASALLLLGGAGALGALRMKRKAA